MLIFQFTLPREERRQVQAQPLTLQNFNPRSHERSDNYIPDEFKSYIISIHAPTRGATKVACYLATLIKFQSTLPREERPVRRYSLPLISVNFNPRSHERSDNIQNLTFALTKRFQSTLPREERRCMRVRIAAPLCNFNPRSHERSDYFTPNKNRLTHVYFNPRSHERSDHCSLYHLSVLQLFQSTLPREERRPRLLRPGGITPISIHAPTRGATAILHKKFVYFYTIPTINI